MMVHGLYRDLKIVVSNLGIRELRLCNVCCRDIKIRVSFLSLPFFLKRDEFANVFRFSDIHRFESGWEYLGYRYWGLASTNMLSLILQSLFLYYYYNKA